MYKSTRSLYRKFPSLFAAGLFAACSGGSAPETDNPPDVQPPDVEPPVVSSETPPSISGGTLVVLKDGRTAIASDPDRDQIHVVDLVQKTVRASIPLDKGDEPGRIAEDNEGRAHVALRNGGAIVTLDAKLGTLVSRRAVCSAPRGITFEAGKNLLHVACAGGELVSIAPTGDAPSRVVELERDLRDVMVRGDKLYVTTFRSAELLVVGANGQAMERFAPATKNSAFNNSAKRGFVSSDGLGSPASPSVAWRMVAGPTGAPLVIHQRGVDGDLGTEPGAYSGFSCAGIVEGGITEIEPEAVDATARVRSGRALAATVLPVDLAVSPNGKQVAIIAAGNGPQHQLQFYAMNAVIDSTAAGSTSAPSMGGAGGSSGGGEFAPGIAFPDDKGGGGEPCLPSSPVPVDGDEPPVDMPPGDDQGLPEPIEFRAPNGQLIAVAFDGKGNIVVQSRQPAMLQILTQRSEPIVLSSVSKASAGHNLFHNATAGLVACASCHPEGGEDHRIWNFVGVGARRTQSLRGGMMDTAPFHWNGELANLGHLMSDVFQGRMSGEQVDNRKMGVLKGWMDSIRTVNVAPRADAGHDPQAVSRGKTLFYSESTKCGTCHTGADFTNNLSYDVGTGGIFQVPQLHGMALRGPFMHNGCAKTMRDRFTAPCGGGDKHGLTSQLSAEQVDDLVSFLDTL